MTASVRLRSLAKINLDLHVLNRRADGYHDLRTVFQTISLADTIEITCTPSRRLRVDIECNLNISGNLIENAAHLLDIPARLKIRLTKRIPMGGGLGGGSSNAAAVLLAVPYLCHKPVPLPKLLDLASQLGSDVPFFLLGGTAAAADRGTDLYPLSDIKPFPAVIVYPGIHVSTPEAYRQLNRPLTDDVPSGKLNNFQGFIWSVASGAPPCEWRPTNDFEAVVFRQHRLLKSIKGKLLELGACPALMSGSGSTLFGIFANRGERDRAVLSLQKEYGMDRVFPVALVGRGAYRSLWWRQLRAPEDLRTWPPQNRYAR